MYQDRMESVLKALVEAWLVENELDQPSLIPDWLPDMFKALHERETTPWIDFTRPGYDDTDLFEFLKGINRFFPVEYENNGESWMFRFGLLGMESCISLEGSCYKVSPVGKTWEN